MNNQKEPPLVVIKNFDAFERVEIFLRVKSRLPDQKGDKITQEILDEFVRKYEAGELKQVMVNLQYLYEKIKSGGFEI